jgi:methionyl-tRNA formyltransferase
VAFFCLKLFTLKNEIAAPKKQLSLRYLYFFYAKQTNMRLIIFTNRDLASNYNLNLLLPYLSKYVVQIFISDKVGGKNNTPPPQALLDLKFFEQELPNTLLFPQFENNNSRNLDDKLLSFNELGKKYNLPIESLNDVKSTVSLKLIANLKPDLVLSVRYGKIFGSDFLKIPKLGTINLHSGKLPNYRGVLAAFRALKNGDETLHGTLHYIEDGTIDTGGIIGFSTLKVDKSRSLLSHILDIYPQSTELIVSTIEQIARGKRPTIVTQTNEGAAYFTFPTQADVEDFEEKGWAFVKTGAYSEFIKKYM